MILPEILAQNIDLDVHTVIGWDLLHFIFAREIQPVPLFRRFSWKSVYLHFWLARSSLEDSGHMVGLRLTGGPALGSTTGPAKAPTVHPLSTILLAIIPLAATLLLSNCPLYSIPLSTIIH